MEFQIFYFLIGFPVLFLIINFLLFLYYNLTIKKNPSLSSLKTPLPTKTLPTQQRQRRPLRRLKVILEEEPHPQQITIGTRL